MNKEKENSKIIISLDLDLIFIGRQKPRGKELATLSHLPMAQHKCPP